MKLEIEELEETVEVMVKKNELEAGKITFLANQDGLYVKIKI